MNAVRYVPGTHWPESDLRHVYRETTRFPYPCATCCQNQRDNPNHITEEERERLAAAYERIAVDRALLHERTTTGIDRRHPADKPIDYFSGDNS